MNGLARIMLRWKSAWMERDWISGNWELLVAICFTGTDYDMFGIMGFCWTSKTTNQCITYESLFLKIIDRENSSVEHALAEEDQYNASFS